MTDRQAVKDDPGVGSETFIEGVKDKSTGAAIRSDVLATKGYRERVHARAPDGNGTPRSRTCNVINFKVCSSQV